MKAYARSLKYLAEDWAPVGVALPEILIKPPPTRLEDEHVPLGQKAQVQYLFTSLNSFRKKKLRD